MNTSTNKITDKPPRLPSNRWKEVRRVSAEISSNGALLQVVGHCATLKKANVLLETHPRRVSIAGPFKNGLTAVLEEERVTLTSPAESHRLFLKGLPFSSSQRWDPELIAVFAGELFEVLLLTPYLLANPSFELTKTGQSGLVHFKQRFVSLSNLQSFHFDRAGLLLRHDFTINYLGGSRVTRYPRHYENINGLSIPTVHEVFVRLSDDSVLPQPIVLFIKVNTLKIETNSTEEESL